LTNEKYSVYFESQRQFKVFITMLSTKIRTENLQDNYSVDLYAGTLHINAGASDKSIEGLLSFASRYNEKRQYMFASNVLGKYIPAEPRRIEAAQLALISDLTLHNEVTTVVGFAESACGLGEAMFHKIVDTNTGLKDKSAYIHTTRQHLPTDEILIEFKEPHSHAADQVLLKPKSEDISSIMRDSTCLVVVEDEITTGNTLRNFLCEYFKYHKNIKRLVILTYVDWRTDSQRLNLSYDFPYLQVQTQCLLSGNISFDVKKENKTYEKPEKTAILTQPHYAQYGAKFGKKYSDESLDKTIEEIRANTSNFSQPMIISGTSEFTYWAQRIATAVAELGGDVRVLSTTRAPLQVGNDIHSKMTFQSHYGDGEEHFLYNLQTDRKLFICYENQHQADAHAALLVSLDAFGLVKGE